MLSGGKSVEERTATTGDLSNCDREPIHIPGSIQPHGVLIVLDPADFRVLQVSENLAEAFGVSVQDALDRPFAKVLEFEWALLLQADLRRRLLDAGPERAAASRPVFLRTVAVDRDSERRFHAIAHRASAGLVLEFEGVADEASDEATSDLHPLVDGFTLRLEAAESISAISFIACDAIRRLTGFDRVLIYRFDEDWNGTVIGEAGSGRLPSYLDHRFPASDIPVQTRELYRVNRLRIIPDAGYQPVQVIPAISPRTGTRLDMSFSTLRSVSPVHVEYMRNMETASSMSVSILRAGQLWGLISCHHHAPKTVAFPVRNACDLFARAFSLRLSALEHAEDFEHQIATRSAYSRLLKSMTDRGGFAAALSESSQDLLDIPRAQGAALVTQEGCWLVGTTPTETQVRELAEWLFASVQRDVYETERLPSVFPPSREYKEQASGLLAVAISKLHPSYVLWFRPEVIQTIQWSGAPGKPVEAEGEQMRLHPRRSFATWREIVRDQALPWKASDVEGASELRNVIVGTVLRKAEELASLNAELTHSNKELEAFSYSVSHDLRAPLRHIVGYAEILREESGEQLSALGQRCLATIVESSEYAGRLVDKLLGYSRLGRSQLQRTRGDLNVLVEEVRRDVMQDADGRNIVWRFAELPTVSADLMMLRMAVRDLMSNAVKYTRTREEAVIEFGSCEDPAEHTFWVKDNGVSFSMEYADKLFGVFQRLHRWEDYEGTGIGLANVRRVFERHGGRTWAEGEEDQGAAFFFTLPKGSQ